jgi:hypothetical protein
MKITPKVITSLMGWGSLAFMAGCGGTDSSVYRETGSPLTAPVTLPTPIASATPTPLPGTSPAPNPTPTPLPLPTPSPTTPPTSPLPAMTADQLRAVPQRITVEGRTLVATAAVWIDRMPSTTPNSRTLYATISVVAANGSPIPEVLVMDRISVVRAEEVWASTAVERYQTSLRSDGTIHGGPLWSPGATVDTVADLYDSSGRRYQIRATTGKVTVTY